jgi:hypothetical protein
MFIKKEYDHTAQHIHTISTLLQAQEINLVVEF